jgi:hypothetical protein
MQEVKKKGFTLGNKKQSEEARPNQRAKSSREVCLDVAPTPTGNLNASEQVTNSKPPQLSGPFFFSDWHVKPTF